MALQKTGDYARQLETAVEATGVTGASFAYWDGNTLHTAVAGVRNSVTRDPVTTDTVMHIGSITKVMNAALLMQLVDDGKIALDDPVVKYLPELRLRDSEALKRITCRMLVNHTSGINGDWLPEYGPDQERIVDLIERCADLGQLHAPGEATSYCNVATVIAGYLTQKLREESWYTLMKTRIYEPLELQHSLVDPLDVPRFRCSVGDVTDHETGKRMQTLRPFLAPSFAPAGSTQMMTATDLVTFAMALLNGGVGRNGARVLSAAAAASMSQPTAEFFAPVGWKMGLGWMIMPGGVLNHGGAGRGVQSILYAHPASGRAVALLTNFDRGFELKPTILDPILESWTGIRTRVPQRLTHTFDSGIYEGVYENNMFRLGIFAREGGLSLRFGSVDSKLDELYDCDPSLAAQLHPLGDHLFEPEYVTPGMPNLKGEPLQLFRFVQPESGGRARYLALGCRLYVAQKA